MLGRMGGCGKTEGKDDMADVVVTVRPARQEEVSTSCKEQEGPRLWRCPPPATPTRCPMPLPEVQHPC